MIRTYFLPVLIIHHTEQVAGVEFIHDALLDITQDPDVRRLIQNTTDAEHDGLILVALSWNVSTQEEQDLYNAQVIIPPPNPDIIRAKELLATSPAVITMPEMWELMRIYGRLLRIT